MHELAIAESVLRIARAHARGRRVAKVELKVGHLRQVVPSALEFSWGLVAEGTEVEGAELAMELVPVAGRCRRCGTVGPLPGFPLMCGSCEGFDVELLQGEELLVEAIEVEDALTVNGGMGSGD